MFISVMTQIKGQSKTVDLVLSDANSLIELLMIYEKSDRVKAYRVIPLGLPPVKDFKSEYGWGREFFTKNQPDRFDWSDN